MDMAAAASLVGRAAATAAMIRGTACMYPAYGFVKVFRNGSAFACA
jgi:hypothetical protein